MMYVLLTCHNALGYALELFAVAIMGMSFDRWKSRAYSTPWERVFLKQRNQNLIVFELQNQACDKLKQKMSL